MVYLAYHKVDTKFEFGMTTTKPDKFRKHICGLIKAGFSFKDLLSNSVKLTFDDGYECFYKNVVPVLDEFGIKAMVFPIAGFVGLTNSWDIKLSFKRYCHMDRRQIREVAAMGHEVGSHTMHHYDLTLLSSAGVRSELEESKKVLEDIAGREISSLSFPFGRFNQRVIEIGNEVGYRSFFGLGSFSKEGVIPRIPVYRYDTAAAVIRKAKMNRADIAIADAIHSFSAISAKRSLSKNGFQVNKEICL
ncbi:MAG: polysaccharide deacetylase family protein [Candidatus Kryptoniota bacterium]